jgi:hypothetical protein
MAAFLHPSASYLRGDPLFFFFHYTSLREMSLDARWMQNG